MHQHEHALPDSSGDEFYDAAQEIPAPWQSFGTPLPLLTFEGDQRLGYPLPPCAASYFARPRSGFNLDNQCLRRLGRAYPIPGNTTLGTRSELDDFCATEATAHRAAVSTARWARDAYQPTVDLQARAAISALHRVHELRRRHDPEGFAVAFPEESENAELPDSSETSQEVLRNTLAQVESTLRDLLAVNRHLASKIESDCRERLADVLGFPAAVKAALGRTPSFEIERLFGSDVEQRIEQTRQSEQRAAFVMAASAMSRIAARPTNNRGRISENRATARPNVFATRMPQDVVNRQQPRLTQGEASLPSVPSFSGFRGSYRPPFRGGPRRGGPPAGIPRSHN